MQTGLQLLKRLEAASLSNQAASVCIVLSKLAYLNRALLCHLVYFVYVEGDFFPEFIQLGLEHFKSIFLYSYSRLQVVSHSHLGFFNLVLDLFVKLREPTSNNRINLICTKFILALLLDCSEGAWLHRRCKRIRSNIFDACLQLLKLGHGLRDAVSHLCTLLLPSLCKLLLQLANIFKPFYLFVLCRIRFL